MLLAQGIMKKAQDGAELTHQIRSLDGEQQDDCGEQHNEMRGVRGQR